MLLQSAFSQVGRWVGSRRSAGNMHAALMAYRFPVVSSCADIGIAPNASEAALVEKGSVLGAWLCAWPSRT
jgi:hypothetical protein